MKLLRTFVVAAAALAASLFTPAAEAQGRWRGGVVFHFGYPWYWWPPAPIWYYPPPPPAVVIERGPLIYIERDDRTEPPDAEPSANRPPTHWWYWCEDAKKYYPYVKECPGGWRRVAPQPRP